MEKLVKTTVANKAKDIASGIFNFPQIDSNLEVWFTFEGKEYELTQFNISFGQAVDHKGQPQNEARGGRILLQLSQTVPDNIYKWAMTSCMRNGTIEFRSKTANSPLKVEFTNAYCVNMDRLIDVNVGMHTDLIISPEEITINGYSLYNKWVK
jgi:hypothetical protein